MVPLLNHCKSLIGVEWWGPLLPATGLSTSTNLKCILPHSFLVVFCGSAKVKQTFFFSMSLLQLVHLRRFMVIHSFFLPLLTPTSTSWCLSWWRHVVFCGCTWVCAVRTIKNDYFTELHANKGWPRKLRLISLRTALHAFAHLLFVKWSFRYISINSLTLTLIDGNQGVWATIKKTVIARHIRLYTFCSDL